MAKIGFGLIILGMGALILKFFGFELKFEQEMGHSEIWVFIGVALFGVLLFFAGFMTER